MYKNHFIPLFETLFYTQKLNKANLTGGIYAKNHFILSSQKLCIFFRVLFAKLWEMNFRENQLFLG